MSLVALGQTLRRCGLGLFRPPALRGCAASASVSQQASREALPAPAAASLPEAPKGPPEPPGASQPPGAPPDTAEGTGQPRKGLRRTILDTLAEWQESNAKPSPEEISRVMFGVAKLTAVQDVLPKTPREQLRTLTLTCEGDWQAEAIAKATHSLQAWPREASTEMLAALLPRLERLDRPVLGHHIGMLLLGSRAAHHGQTTNSFLAQVAAHIGRLEEPMTSASWGMSLFSLSRLPYSRDLVLALAAQVRACGDVAEPMTVANALFGLQHCKPAGPEIQGLLSALAERIEQVEGELEAQHIKSAFFGLQCARDGPGYRAVLSALAPKVGASGAALDGAAIGGALWGLQSCKDGPEVRAVILALAKKVTPDLSLSAREMSDALYGVRNCCGKEELRALLAALVPGMRAESGGEGGLEGGQLARALTGLQGLEDCPERRAVMGLLAEKAAASDSPMSPQELGFALHSLRRCQPSRELRAVLAVLARKMEECPEPFSSGQVAFSLFGLQKCGNIHESKRLLAALVPKLESCGSIFQPQHISQCLYGLQGFRGGAELERTLLAMAARIADSAEPIAGSQCGAAFYGLHNCSDTPGLRAVFAGLAPRLSSLNAQAVSCVLYSLQNCSASEEVKAVLRAVVPEIEAVGTAFAAQNVANSLYGMHRCGDCEETRAALAAMVPKIEGCEEPFRAQAVSMALYGLNNFTESAELRAVLRALVPKIEGCTEALGSQNIGNSLAGVRSCGDCDESRAVLAAIAPKVRECAGALTEQPGSQGLAALRRRGDSPELRAMWAALTVGVAGSSEPLTAAATCAAIATLQGAVGSPEMRGLIAALVPRVAAGERLTLKPFMRALRAALELPDAPEVRSLHAALAKVVPSGSVRPEPADAGAMFYSFSSAKPEVEETSELLRAVVALCMGCREKWTLTDVKRSCSGAMPLASREEVSPFLYMAAGKLGPLVHQLKHGQHDKGLEMLCGLAEACPRPVGEALLRAMRPVLLSDGEQGSSALVERCKERLLALEEPGGWTACEDGGRRFFHHPEHGSRWSLPGLDLPEGWEAHVAPNGSTYYCHPEHGSQWHVPGQGDVQRREATPAAVQLPPGWEAHVAPDGSVYYHHADFGSQWQMPTQAGVESETEKDRLAQQVKDMPLSAQREWRRHCQESGSGKMDPSRHSAEYLQGFLDSMKDSPALVELPPSHWVMACEWQEYYAAREAGPGLLQGFLDSVSAEALSRKVELVQSVKRESGLHREKWERHCQGRGLDSWDPAQQSSESLQAFLDSLQ